MRATVDRSLCIGSGICVAATGGTFELVDTPDGPRARPTGVATPVDDLLRAARTCPTLAIRLTDDSGAVVFPPAT